METEEAKTPMLDDEQRLFAERVGTLLLAHIKPLFNPEMDPKLTLIVRFGADEDATFLCSEDSTEGSTTAMRSMLERTGELLSDGKVPEAAVVEVSQQAVSTIATAEKIVELLRAQGLEAMVFGLPAGDRPADTQEH